MDEEKLNDYIEKYIKEHLKINVELIYDSYTIDKSVKVELLLGEKVIAQSVSECIR